MGIVQHGCIFLPYLIFLGRAASRRCFSAQLARSRCTPPRVINIVGTGVGRTSYTSGYIYLLPRLLQQQASCACGHLASMPSMIVMPYTLIFACIAGESSLFWYMPGRTPVYLLLWRIGRRPGRCRPYSQSYHVHAVW